MRYLTDISFNTLLRNLHRLIMEVVLSKVSRKGIGFRKDELIRLAERLKSQSVKLLFF